MADGHPTAIMTKVDAAARARGEVVGRPYPTWTTTGQGFTNDEVVVHALAGAAGVAIDNTRLQDRARRLQRWLEATGEVTAALLSGAETAKVVQLTANCVLQLTAADYTLIAVPAEPSVASGQITALTVTVCVGEHPDAAAVTGRVVPVTGSTTGAVFTDHVPRNVPLSAFDPADGLGVRFGPALAVPVGPDQALSGVLLAVRIPGSPGFDDDDLQLASALADHAGLALQLVGHDPPRGETWGAART